MFFNLLSLLFTADGQVPGSMHSIAVTFHVDCFLTASIQRELGIKTSMQGLMHLANSQISGKFPLISICCVEHFFCVSK